MRPLTSGALLAVAMAVGAAPSARAADPIFSQGVLHEFRIVMDPADWASLRIPFCPGVRYIPGQPLLRRLQGMGVEDDTDEVPDASRISPPRIDALHPDAAYLSIAGVIESAPRPDGKGRDYCLTRSGEELGDIVVRLGEWGQRWTDRFERQRLDPGLLLWDMRRRIAVDAADDVRIAPGSFGLHRW